MSDVEFEVIRLMFFVALASFLFGLFVGYLLWNKL